MKIVNIWCAVSEKLEEFFRCEDKKYFSNPTAYRRRTDWFFARMALVFAALLFLAVWIMK